jgi:hypothetical protein
MKIPARIIILYLNTFVLFGCYFINLMFLVIIIIVKYMDFLYITQDRIFSG